MNGNVKVKVKAKHRLQDLLCTEVILIRSLVRCLSSPNFSGLFVFLNHFSIYSRSLTGACSTEAMAYRKTDPQNYVPHFLRNYRKRKFQPKQITELNQVPPLTMGEARRPQAVIIGSGASPWGRFGQDELWDSCGPEHEAQTKMECGHGRPFAEQVAVEQVWSVL